jgi:hypothetical protein
LDSSTLKLEAICSSDTLEFLRTTRRYKPKDHILQESKSVHTYSKCICVILNM